MRVYDRLVQILYANMSLSRHFPPSTQTILSAQCTPPPAKKRRDKSIIVISSSPDDNPVPITIDSPPRIFCSDDEEFFGPARSNSPPLLPAAVARKQSRQGLENLALDVNEDDTFSRIIGEYKYTHPKLLTDTANIPRASLQKVNLDGFFQETKKPTTNPPTKSRVKNTLTTRVSLPKRRTSTSNAVVDKLPSSESIAATVSRDHVRFFTSWAAAQAPTTRTKPTAKPRRKTMRKRNSVEVVLLSPRTGQESVRRRVGCEIGGGEGKLGERSDGASAMWDACKRGLDGELYDCDGEVVFSQELRPNVSIDNENEGNSTMKTDDVEIFDMTKSQESSSTMQEDVMTILDTEVRQRNQEVVVLDNRDTSPDTPLQNVSPVSPPPPAEITSQFDQSLEIIDITDLPHTQQTTNTIPVPKIDSPLPIRPKHKENPTTTARSDPIPNYSTYTLAQLQSQVQKYGFKPSKSKPAMITLLQQCHAATLAATTPPPTPDCSSPALEARLHARITESIKADGGWYARILRYEPVVVEELVEWFAGRGIEVAEGVIKRWCDREGVCCVGRESLGGGRRARY